MTGLPFTPRTPSSRDRLLPLCDSCVHCRHITCCVDPPHSPPPSIRRCCRVRPRHGQEPCEIIDRFLDSFSYSLTQNNRLPKACFTLSILPPPLPPPLSPRRTVTGHPRSTVLAVTPPSGSTAQANTDRCSPAWPITATKAGRRRTSRRRRRRSSSSSSRRRRRATGAGWKTCG